MKSRLEETPWSYYGEWSDDFLNVTIPPEPVFESHIDTVRAQVTALANKAPLPKRAPDRLHPAIQRVGDADKTRSKTKRATWGPRPWNAPVVEGPFEKRSLESKPPPDEPFPERASVSTPSSICGLAGHRFNASSKWTPSVCWSTVRILVRLAAEGLPFGLSIRIRLFCGISVRSSRS